MDNHDSRPFVPIGINNKIVKALMDSGAQKSIIDADFLNKQNIKYTVCPTPLKPITIFNGTQKYIIVDLKNKLWTCTTL